MSHCRHADLRSGANTAHRYLTRINAGLLEAVAMNQRRATVNGSMCAGRAPLRISHDSPRAMPRANVERFPSLLTVDEVADLLRTTRRAIYAMVERRQLPGVVRIRRRVLLRADELLHWLDQKRAPSPEE
ncbi:MAG: helix-turn-helix domain-containing protein [Luteitalea sp.]|nr:helix-turn-helix domain-containing protein [Luteitalea sp.]